MAYEERIAAAQEKMDAIKAKMAATTEKVKSAHAMKKEEIAAAIDELDAELAADLAEFAEGMDKEATDAIEGAGAAAEENVRLAKERRDSRIYAFKLKAQMKADALKEKIAERRAEEDKAAMELYILDLLDYAESCEQVAFAAAVEADMALLEAAKVAAEYVEKYGEPEETEEKSE